MSRNEHDEIGGRGPHAPGRLAEEPFALRLDLSFSGEPHGGAAPTASRRGDGQHPLELTGQAPVAAIQRVVLDDALVVPAGAILRGRVCARALLLAGEIVGTVHCGAGPVVIRPGASLKGQLIAGGDVHVCGSVIDYAGGTVITTPARLVLARGARVEGDVRSGRLEIHEGATLNGVARGFDR
jgi:cytoskeletal protein CcmA (bactofilin family)